MSVKPEINSEFIPNIKKEPIQELDSIQFVGGDPTPKANKKTLFTLLTMLLLLPALTLATLNQTVWKSRAQEVVTPPTTPPIDIPSTPTQAPSPNPFSKMSAKLAYPGPAAFAFTFTQPGPTKPGQFTIDVSTDPNLTSNVFADFASSTSLPVTITNPNKWSSYSCGTTIYWIVKTTSGYKSPITSTSVLCSASGTFSNFSSNLKYPGPASFFFDYKGTATSFTVDISADSTFTTNVRKNIDTTVTSPAIANDLSSLSYYGCNKTIYWRVTSNKNETSPIQKNQVSCIFSNFSSSMQYPRPASFFFDYNGLGKTFTVDVSSSPTFSTDVRTKVDVTTKSPAIWTGPDTWPSYTCGKTLYWKVSSDKGEISSIQSNTVVCPSQPKPTITSTPTPTIAKIIPMVPNRPPASSLPTFTTTSLPYGFAGTAYSATIQATSPTSITMTMSATGLLEGMTFGSCVNSISTAGKITSTITCKISGTPKNQYFFRNVNIKVTDQMGKTVTKTYQLNILPSTWKRFFR